MIGAEGEERTFARVAFSTEHLLNVLFTEETRNHQWVIS